MAGAVIAIVLAAYSDLDPAPAAAAGDTALAPAD
jgi:hypothetical protein